MTTLADALAIGRLDHNLAVVSTLRADATIQASVVNAGELAHPGTGAAVVAFVTYGRAKLANLRVRPSLSLTFRSGPRWATVEGEAQLIGPDDPSDDVAPGGVPGLLRAIFVAAGGSHDDWAAFDATMAAQRRVAVLVAPRRVYSN
jgi:PPOX class probable F420-dependent enzyme